MSLLQRRLFEEFLRTFLLALVVLLLFILMGRAIQLRNMLFGLNMGVGETLRLFGYLSPFFLLMVCPVACMLAVFLTFLRMGTDRELVALRAGGISLYQLLAAPIVFGFLCMLLGLWISLYWQAWGMSHFRAAVLNVARDSARVLVQPGVFNKEIPGMVFFARKVDPVKGTMAQVLVEDTSRAEGAVTILAPEGSLGTDYHRGELLLLLKNGRMYADRGQNISVMGFEEYVVRLSLDAVFQGLDLGPIKPNEMSWTDLIGMPVAEILPENPRLGNKIIVERHKRWIFPVACLVLSLFAIPIAVSFQGLHRQSGLVPALFVFLIYYSVISAGISLGESGAVPPLLGLWAPNALFLLLGLWGIRLAALERMPRIDRLRGLRRKGRKAGAEGPA